MAIALDQVLGSNTKNINAGGTQTITITTGAIAAAGSRIVVVVSWFDSGATTTITCSDGTAYTKDKEFDNGGDRTAIFSRVLVGSLASGSTITVTFVSSGVTGGSLAAACSYSGTTSVDTTGTATGTTAAGWSTGSVACALADSLYVAVAATDGTIASESSTPTNGNERADLFLLAANQGAVMQDLIVSSIASNAVTGTWGTTTGLSTQTMAVVIYKGTVSAASPFGSPNLPFMAPQGGIL